MCTVHVYHTCRFQQLCSLHWSLPLWVWQRRELVSSMEMTVLRYTYVIWLYSHNYTMYYCICTCRAHIVVGKHHIHVPGWRGPWDAPVLCGNRVVCSTVMPRGTAPNRGFLLSQQCDRRRMERKGSSSQHAVEPSATGLPQAKALTDAMLVQHRNAFVVYFLAFAVGRGWRC